MKKFISDFKAFALKGNVVDMAVGVIIGGAFGKIVTSLVNDIIMPAISMLIGGLHITEDGLDVTEWKHVIEEAVIDKAGTVITAETAIRYGMFIQNIIDFFIIALCIFIMIKLIMGLHKKFEKKQEEEAAAPTTKVCPFCKSEIAIDATRCAHCTSELQE